MGTSPQSRQSNDPAALAVELEEIGRSYAATRAALKEMEERYRLFADNVHDLISLHDLTGTFLYVSPSATELLGFDPQELVGRSVYELVFGDDIATLRAAHDSLSGNHDRSPAVYRAQRRDGSLIWCETTARIALDDVTGEPWHIVAVTRDITERRAFEQHLLQSQKMEALGRLAAGVAHDFNNVLTVIAGHAELLTGCLDDGTMERDHAEYIREAAHRASTLTRKLLSFGRGKGRGLQMTDLNETILDIQPMLARLIGSDIRILHELQPRLLTVRCEPAALEQVLVNLAVNARDAMPDGGILTFRTENVVESRDHPAVRAGRYVRLTVSDNGIGMPGHVAARVFEPFFTTRDPDGASGLGLSTVYSILRQAGGDVMVDTAPGAGATFRLLFPGHDSPATTNEVPAQRDADLHGTEMVLVAEDDVGVRALVVATLQKYGYRVMAAVDGLQAFDLFRTYGHLIDMIVTDVNMPEMKGPDFVRALTADGTDVPVLYISGFTAQTLHLRDSAPRHAFLAKPFAPIELARAVRQMLP